MHKSHVFISTLLQLSYGLITAAAALSRPSPVATNDVLSIPNGSVVENLPLLVAASVPFAYGSIIFDFTTFEAPIPKREVENVLTSADEVISDLVDQSPFESITNNRFEHRALGGNTLISIQANVGKTITWAQLFCLLQGLYRFMIGMGVRQQHCQALDFTIGIAGQENVGLGIVRYLPRSENEVQKREPMLVSNSSLNQPVLPPANGSSLSPASILNEDPFIWHIPETSLSLNIYFFGILIPKEHVRATLEGAIAEILPNATGEKRDDGIENGAFDWSLPPTGDGTRTGVTVLASWNHDVTWEQLSEILYGLYQFTAAYEYSAEHRCQVLGFRIIDRHEGKIAIGTLWHYPRRAEVAKRASSADQDSLQLPNLTSAALTAGTSGISMARPVRDANVVLDFTFLGQDIPNLEAIETLDSAQKYIADVVRKQPRGPSLNDRFNFKPAKSNAYINVVTAQHRSITWLELSQVLFGVTHFCDDKNHRVLMFDIDIGGVRVGFGTLSYSEHEPPSKVEKRTINGTLTVPNLVAGSILIPYNIPNTKDYLDFNSFGKAIPSSVALEAISFGLQDISEFVQGIPNSPVPRNHYRYDVDSGVSISILPSTFVRMTWSQLDKILTGLMCFVTGVNPLPGRDLQTHYQILGFNMRMHGPGYIGTGMLGYTPPPEVEVEKRVAVDDEVVRYLSTRKDLGKRSLANTNLLPPQPTGDIQSSSNDTTLTATLPFRVLDTPDEIVARDASPTQQPSGTVASPPATLSSNSGSLRLGEGLSSGNASASDIEQSDIRFPIINTSITLVFTKFGASKIPIDTVNDLFNTVTEDIQSSVATESNSAIPCPMWYFKVESVRGGATLSISIYTRTNHKVTWLELRKILSGLELFMGAQRSSLNFDIDIGDDVEVAKGVIWYSPPRPLEVNTAAKRAITANEQLPRRMDETVHPSNPALSAPSSPASLAIPIPYPVPSTPMTLTINLRGPSVPYIHLSGHLSTALLRLRTNITTIPNAPIPWNAYRYRDSTSELVFSYIGYSDTAWLTWQQLGWIIRGLLGFVGERQTNCRAMAVEVEIREGRAERSTTFGAFILWYTEH